MAATDARAIPFKNAAYRVTFPILDADGDLVTGATGLDSEVSLDAGTFADCTNEATEIATSSGMYYLDLTAAEMNADTVAVIVKTTSTGAKTTVLTLYPQEDGDLKANVTQAAGTAWGSGAITAASIADGAIDAATFAADVWTRLGIVAYGTAQAVTGTTIQLASASAFADDELLGAVVVITGGSTGVGQSRMITDYVSSTDTATVDTWTTTPTGTISYVVFAAAPASATSLPAVNVTQISGDATAADNLELACDGTGYPLGGGSIVAASVTGNVGGNVTGSVGSVVGDVGGNVNGSVAAVVSVGTGAITAASIATGAIDADAIATDAVTEIQSGLATASALSTVAGYIDTEVAAIKAKTDLIPAAPAATGDIPTAAAIADAVWDEALAGHAGAGSAGLALSTASSGGVDPSVLADAIWDEALSGHATAGTSGKALADVLVDTAEIGTAGAGLTALATAANLSTVAGYLDTEVAAILAAVDTEVGAIKAKTDNLPAAPAATGDIPTAATVADAVWDEARSGHVSAGSFGEGAASVQGNVTGSVGSVSGAVGSVTGAVGSVTAGVTLAADAISASALSAAAVDEILDEQIGDGTITLRQAVRGILAAAAAGKLSGAATTSVTIRNVADTQNVVVATVDADGNRTAVTFTP